MQIMTKDGWKMIGTPAVPAPVEPRVTPAEEVRREERVKVYKRIVQTPLRKAIKKRKS